MFLFFFVGNDFLFPFDRDSKYSSEFSEIMTNFIAEKPNPSLIGFLFPRLNWLLVNKFRISEFAMGNKPIPDESRILTNLSQLPKRKGLNALACHMKKYYFPWKDAIHVESILNRGDGRLWDVVQPKEKDQEQWAGWQFETLLRHEFQNTETLKETPSFYDSIVSTTISWLEAIHDLCREAHIPFVLFIIPVASDIDPEYVDFWSPWPAFFADLNNTTPLGNRFKTELENKGINYVDLGNQLRNIGATYRKMDGHWTEKGHEVVSRMVVNELEKLIVN